jgi:hypothetical protein
VKWLDTIVTINTTNVVKGTFEVLYPKKGNEEYDESKKQLLTKLYKVQVACRRYSGNKTKTISWRVQALKGAMEAHMGWGWYGYHPMPRSWKYQEIGWKVDMRRYDGYESREWGTFLVT